MDAFDKLVEKHFPQLGPLQMLMEMVEKELDGFVPKEVLKEAEEISKSIMDLMPKFEISEAWGQKDTEARHQFEVYMNNIPYTGVEDKLRYLNKFILNIDPGSYEVHEILSNLMFLDLLSTVVNNFSPSGSGFLFEAFMAGLLKGTQQIEKAGGELQIDDLITGEGKPISLKLLSPSSNIKGSIKNLIGFLANPGNDSIEYLCVYKYGSESTSSIAFYSFIIDPENIYYWLSKSFKFGVKYTELSESDDRRGPSQRLEPAKRAELITRQNEVAKLVRQTIARGSSLKHPERRLNMLISLKAKKGLELIKKAAAEYKHSVPEEFNLSDEQLIALSDEEVDAVVQARKMFVNGLRGSIPPEHELGVLRKAYTDVSLEMGLKTVDQYIELYKTNPIQWANELLAAAGLEPLSNLSEERKDSTQFAIDSDFITSRQVPDIYKKTRLGNLSVDRKKVQALAEEYTKTLQGSVIAIFSLLSKLAQGITGYYLTPEGKGDRFHHGGEAVAASIDMKDLITDPEKGFKQQ